MLKLKKIAVTGGTASGKSTVCRIFQNLGAYVISADQITHQLLSKDTSLIRQVADLLGQEVLQGDQIDRKKVAEIVFEDREKLAQLEALIHPKVMEEVHHEWGKKRCENNCSLFVVEIPLLFESQDTQWYDAIIVVTCPLEKARSRFCQSTGYSSEEFDRRMARQLPPEEKAKRATFVVGNDSTIDSLEAQVRKIYSKLNEMSPI